MPRQGSPGYALVCLYSSMADRDWPDYLDTQAGTFTYYGDNKRPGHRLEDTPRGGNRAAGEPFYGPDVDPGDSGLDALSNHAVEAANFLVGVDPGNAWGTFRNAGRFLPALYFFG